MTGADVVQEARRWVGVPFHWGGSNEHGTDCFGLLLGVARNLGMTDWQPPNYSRQFDDPLLYSFLEHLCFCRGVGRPASIPPIRAGMVVQFMAHRRAHHLAIATGPPGAALIHTDSTHGVVESGFSDRLFDRLHAVWEFKGLD
jgi:cell wall-associated NlpC family hydrolase